MPTDLDQHRAQEADRLLSHEPLLKEALDSLKQRTLEALGAVEPTDADTIRKLQAVVLACEGIPIELAQIIASGGGMQVQPEPQPE
jgi:hypothetical protein